jgi:aryl-alcohol dehydrogenase-like predicted oxidoreductase
MTSGRLGNTDHDECVRIVRRALDEGVTFIDTANRYAMGESEEIVGKALEGRREEAVVATKVFMPGPGGILDRGTSRRHVFLQVGGLRRLRTDWMTSSDSSRSMGHAARRDPRRLSDPSARVRYLAVSTGTLAESRSMYFGGWRMVESLWISERRQLERFVSTQPPYSILTREAGASFPVCEAHGLGPRLSPHGRMAGGPLPQRAPVPADSRAERERVRHSVCPASIQPRGRRVDSRSWRSWSRMADEVGVAGALRRRVGAAQPAVTSAIMGVQMRH